MMNAIDSGSPVRVHTLWIAKRYLQRTARGGLVKVLEHLLDYQGSIRVIDREALPGKIESVENRCQVPGVKIVEARDKFVTALYDVVSTLGENVYMFVEEFKISGGRLGYVSLDFYPFSCSLDVVGRIGVLANAVETILWKDAWGGTDLQSFIWNLHDSPEYGDGRFLHPEFGVAPIDAKQ